MSVGNAIKIMARDLKLEGKNKIEILKIITNKYWKAQNGFSIDFYPLPQNSELGFLPRLFRKLPVLDKVYIYLSIYKDVTIGIQWAIEEKQIK